MNLDPDCDLIEGDHDHRVCRVVDGSVTAWLPPQPDADHAWDDVMRRWVNVRAERESRNRQRMQELESKQARIVRELLLGDESARARLAEIDAEIATLRS